MEQMTPHFMGAMMGAMVVLAAPAFVLVAGLAILTYRKRSGGDD